MPQPPRNADDEENRSLSADSSQPSFYNIQGFAPWAPRRSTLNEVFQRVTVPKVPTSLLANIAFSILKPSTWTLLREEAWLGLRPLVRRDCCFLLLMSHRDASDAPALLREDEGLSHFLRAQFEAFEGAPSACPDDDNCPYEVLAFQARMPDVSGRLHGLATMVPVEDVFFTMLALARVETFHTRMATLQTILGSFHPIVTGTR